MSNRRGYGTEKGIFSIFDLIQLKSNHSPVENLIIKGIFLNRTCALECIKAFSLVLIDLNSDKRA